VYSQNDRPARRKAIFPERRVAARPFFEGVKAQIRPAKAMHRYWCGMSARPASSLPDTFGGLSNANSAAVYWRSKVLNSLSFKALFRVG
jgi:hypothetical protein